jgi:hypothetical protein
VSAKAGKSKMEDLNRDEEQRKNKRSLDIRGNSTAEEPFAQRTVN